MSDVLGIELPEEVLPLSNTCAIVPPFFLRPNTVLALEASRLSYAYLPRDAQTLSPRAGLLEAKTTIPLRRLLKEVAK